MSQRKLRTIRDFATCRLQAHNLKVVGSNPTPATTLPLPDHSAAPLPSAVRSRLMTSAARCSPVQAYFKTARPRRNSGPSRTVCYGRARPCGMWFPQPRCSRIAKRHAPLMALSLLPGMQAARRRPALIFRSRCSAVRFGIWHRMRKLSNLISWSHHSPSGAASTSWVNCGRIHSGKAGESPRERGATDCAMPGAGRGFECRGMGLAMPRQVAAGRCRHRLPVPTTGLPGYRTVCSPASAPSRKYPAW